MAAAMPTMALVMSTVPAVLRRPAGRWGRAREPRARLRGHGWLALRDGLSLRLLELGAPLNNLIQFPAIEPYAAALRAKVDFDALTVTHDEIDATTGTRHADGWPVSNGITHELPSSPAVFEAMH
jgi:hypothetical protein